MGERTCVNGTTFYSDPLFFPFHVVLQSIKQVSYAFMNISIANEYKELFEPS